MASGELPWSLAEPLARRLPGVERVDVRSGDDGVSIAARSAGRSVVLVVRDPIRHRWQLGLLGDATVVVDVGWPVDLDTATPVIRTRGVAPALLEAAAARLAEG
jgi:hypothetical protein